MDSERLVVAAGRRVVRRRRLMVVAVNLVAVVLVVLTRLPGSGEPVPEPAAALDASIKLYPGRGTFSARVNLGHGPGADGLEFVGISTRPQDPDAVFMPAARHQEYVDSGTELSQAEWKAQNEGSW